MPEKIGFIGTGVMGRSMAGHLLEAGHTITVHNRTPEKAESLLENGAAWADTPAEIARASDFVITIVGFPDDVESTYLGENGLVAHAEAGTRLIDMTTSCPRLAARIHEEGKQRGVGVLDAPVSGGDLGAREAKLSIMVGGDKEVFESCRFLFEIMGRNIVYQGPAGSGQHTKMANQVAIAGGMLGVCESLAYARKAGLDPESVLASISGGAAGSWSLSNLAPRILANDFDPGFYVKHFIKDMDIASASSKSMDLDAHGLELALELYRKLAKEGCADLGTQALYKIYDQQNDQ